MDFAPNLQQLRHTRSAGLVRKLIYALLVRDRWPPVFVSARRADVVHVPSRNVYVHLPFCLTICPHCPYNKLRWKADLAAQYRTALLREIASYVARSDAMPVETLYFGGGTPSLTPDAIAAAIDAFGPLLNDRTEIAVEVYPTHATPDRLRALREKGVNRVSLGIESLDAALLRKLGRRYAPEQAKDAIRNSVNAGFEMIDVNLIFGIPGQLEDAFLAGVRDCLDEGVDQISAYPLFTFDHTPAGDVSHEATYARASERRRVAMQRGVSRLCRDAGMERTSVWSFTRQGASPYTTVTRPDYVGFGAGAGSKWAAGMTFNTFSVEAYIEASPGAIAIRYDLSERAQKADWLYWQVYNARIDAREYEARFGRPLERDFPFVIWAMRRIGFVQGDQSGYKLTERGAVLGHRIQSLFSLNAIDAVWTECRKEAWPGSVAVA